MGSDNLTMELLKVADYMTRTKPRQLGYYDAYQEQGPGVDSWSQVVPFGKQWPPDIKAVGDPQTLHEHLNNAIIRAMQYNRGDVNMEHVYDKLGTMLRWINKPRPSDLGYVERIRPDAFLGMLKNAPDQILAAYYTSPQFGDRKIPQRQTRMLNYMKHAMPEKALKPLKRELERSRNPRPVRYSSQFVEDVLD